MTASQSRAVYRKTRMLCFWAKKDAVSYVDDDGIFDNGCCVAREFKMDGLGGEVVVEVGLGREFEHEAVRHAFAVGLPTPILTGLEIFDQRRTGFWVKRCGLKRHEGFEMRFELRPCYVGAVFEEHDVRYCFAHGYGW
jgi:hypothetical protein